MIAATVSAAVLAVLFLYAAIWNARERDRLDARLEWQRKLSDRLISKIDHLESEVESHRVQKVEALKERDKRDESRSALRSELRDMTDRLDRARNQKLDLECRIEAMKRAVMEAAE